MSVNRTGAHSNGCATASSCWSACWSRVAVAPDGVKNGNRRCGTTFIHMGKGPARCRVLRCW